MNIGTVNYHDNHQNQIAIQIHPRPLPPAPNLPRLDHLTEDYSICDVFKRAVYNDDWEAAEGVLHQNPELVRCAITVDLDTPLHFAVYYAKSNKFVENLVNLMDEEDLELQNKSYKTALSLAAAYNQKVEIAKMMLEKNKYLLEIPDNEGMMPLHVAAGRGKYEMMRYLYDKSNKMNTDCWTPENRSLVLHRCVKSYRFDFAVQLLNDHPELISNKKLLANVLLVLAQKTDLFKETEPKSIFDVKVGRDEGESDGPKLLRLIKEKIARMGKNEIIDILKGPPMEIGEGQDKETTYPSRLLFVAVERGNTGFVLELIQLYSLYPDLILMVDDKGRSIFHLAVEHRDTEIYNLIYEIGSMKEVITHMEDVEGNNLLHFVGKSVYKPKGFAFVPTVFIQMQDELLFWFKEVEKMVPFAYRQKKNKEGETPQDLFTKRRDHLLIETEKSMKDTFPFIFVSTVFTYTSAYALWSEYNNKRNPGLPFFYQKKPAFIVSVIACAMSLIFSSTSLLLFLSIPKPPFLELHSMKLFLRNLMFGFAALNLYIVTMLVAISASCFLLFGEEQKWIPIMLAGFIGMFIVLVFNVVCDQKDFFYLTYGSRLIFKSKKRMAYLKSV